MQYTIAWTNYFIKGSFWRSRLCFHSQDLPDTRGEGQERRRAAEEARADSEDSGGHLRPKAEEWTFKVIFCPII